MLVELWKTEFVAVDLECHYGTPAYNNYYAGILLLTQ